MATSLVAWCPWTGRVGVTSVDLVEQTVDQVHTDEVVLASERSVLETQTAVVVDVEHGHRGRDLQFAGAGTESLLALV